MPKLRDVPQNLKSYYLGLLRKGERWNEVEGSEDLTPRQLAFIREQVEAGVYKVAGPVVDGGEIVGMMLVEAPTPEDALAIASKDPAVQANRLTVEIYPTFLPSLDSLRVEY